ncbi:homoserine kinase [mine drainage metagenome]|uniref:Homoserine kinase n=1 Tax=mine drainage metagenome TaxID=410659 RepID=T1AI61_9ZZZZ
MNGAASMNTWARARAPASVGNVAAGFDLLGHTFAGPADEVLVRRVPTPGVRINAIHGSAAPLPRDAARNTAGAALLALGAALHLDSVSRSRSTRASPTPRVWAARRHRAWPPWSPPMRCCPRH